MSDRISFSLLENALDFLTTAVGYVKRRDEQERSHKYAVLHLCDGIELLLKCRLDSKHWTLVLAAIGHTKAEHIRTGDFRSVGWDNAIARLEEIVGIEFETTEKTLLTHLRKTRNRIHHFEVHIERNRRI